MSDNIIEVQEEEVVAATPTKSKDIVEQLKNFWDNNSKNLLIGSGAIVAVIVGWIGYTELIQKPNEEKAADAIFKAQQYFAQDSSRKVLDGDANSKGVLYVINKFGGTKAANLAHFYAGISYLKLGDFKKSVEHLKDFSTDAKQVQMVAYGALADAYAEQGNKEEAVGYYKKAGSTFESDEANSAEYLFRAGLLNETLNKPKDALEIYKEIKAKYPKTDKGAQIDKYIYRLSNEKSELSVN